MGSFLIADCTNFFDSSIAPMPDQDVLWGSNTPWCCLDINFVSYYTCFGRVMDSKRHIMCLLLSIRCPSMLKKTQILCLGIIYLFLKRMDPARGRQEKRRSRWYFCAAVCHKNPLLLYILDAHKVQIWWNLGRFFHENSII